MADFWTSNPAYQEYKAARWRRDLGRAAELVAGGLAGADSLERACWLVAKASLCADMPDLPENMRLARNLLAEALSSAPADHQLRRSAIQVALGIAVNEGPALQLFDILRSLRSQLRDMLRAPGISYNIGVLRFYGGNWRQSLLWLNRSFSGGFVSSGGAAGQAVPLSVRARVNARLGRRYAAETDLQEACQRFERYGQGLPRHPGLTIAQAELALMNGRTQDARTVMQEYFVGSAGFRFPAHAVHANMVAAELAMAEGNPEGYRYYCDLALETCREHDLSISIHYVHAVMAQAERQHGAPPAP